MSDAVSDVQQCDMREGEGSEWNVRRLITIHSGHFDLFEESFLLYLFCFVLNACLFFALSNHLFILHGQNQKSMHKSINHTVCGEPRTDINAEQCTSAADAHQMAVAHPSAFTPLEPDAVHCDPGPERK